LTSFFKIGFVKPSYGQRRKRRKTAILSGNYRRCGNTVGFLYEKVILTSDAIRKDAGLRVGATLRSERR